ncbi:MAG: DUF417 family protein [Sneathiella sp.]|nr:DUF417 family protein [Sneathiella sp.]
MSVQTQNTVDLTGMSDTLIKVSEIAIRYALVMVFVWYGLLKFTAYEANAIAGFAINSPFLAWLHEALGVRGFSNLIGVVELFAAFLIAAHPISARMGVIGGLVASSTFLVTLSFMFTTPGIFVESPGAFPILSVVPGAFLLKDVVLLAVSVWLVAKSLQTYHRNIKEI